MRARLASFDSQKTITTRFPRYYQRKELAFVVNRMQSRAKAPVILMRGECARPSSYDRLLPIADGELSLANVGVSDNGCGLDRTASL